MMERRRRKKGSELSVIINSVVTLAFGDVRAEIPCSSSEDVAVVHVVAAYGGLAMILDLIYVVARGCNSDESPVVGAWKAERRSRCGCCEDCETER